MCIFPQLIKNKKYTPNKKNEGRVPKVKDRRVLAVPIGCGFCIECKHKEAKNWQVRLAEDVKENTNGKFVTLTFSNESIKELEKEINKDLEYPLTGYDLDNAIATRAVRHFCEKWRWRSRKKYGRKNGKSVRHWFITELGHKGTENIHLHGIVWTDEKPEEIRECWDWGYSWIGKKNDNGDTKNYVNAKTVNYIVKYVKKVDVDHKFFKPKVLSTGGIGRNYMNRNDWKKNKYIEYKTDESYVTNTGHKMSLPIYYRNKIYNEDEREKLWLEKLDKKKRYVMGVKIDISTKEGEEMYFEAVKEARRKNERLGYNYVGNWDRKKYEEKRRIMLTNKRINETKIKEIKNNEKWNYRSQDNWE